MVERERKQAFSLRDLWEGRRSSASRFAGIRQAFGLRENAGDAVWGHTAYRAQVGSSRWTQAVACWVSSAEFFRLSFRLICSR